MENKEIKKENCTIFMSFFFFRIHKFFFFLLFSVGSKIWRGEGFLIYPSEFFCNSRHIDPRQRTVFSLDISKNFEDKFLRNVFFSIEITRAVYDAQNIGNS
jgi:hypothetical protein